MLEPTYAEESWYFFGSYLIKHGTIIITYEDGSSDDIKLNYVPYHAGIYGSGEWKPFYETGTDCLGFSTYENALRFITNIHKGRPEFEGIERVDSNGETC